MSTVELKKELHELIDSGDDTFVKMFYEMAKVYIKQSHRDKMILEGEEDIKSGRILSLKDAQILLDNWEG